MENPTVRRRAQYRYYSRFSIPIVLPRRMPALAVLSTLFLLAAFTLLHSAAAQTDELKPGSLKFIELYTSHGCSSCPPADRLLAELLSEEKALIALEFHVDYWNRLVHGSAGSFTDPFSSAAYSERQRQYNSSSLRGRPGVYTPQVIVNGRFATVGSDRRQITKALSQPVDQLLAISLEPAEGSEKLTVTINGSDDQRKELAGVGIVLARYLDNATTQITGGENKDITLTNHHIVTDLTPLGEVSAEGEMMFTIDSPAASEGCVVLVQQEALTPIYAAAACP